jgi:hypothetical protein
MQAIFYFSEQQRLIVKISTNNIITIKSRELSSVDRTLHYIYRKSKFKFLSSHLSTLKVKFLTTRLLGKKIYNHKLILIIYNS